MIIRPLHKTDLKELAGKQTSEWIVVSLLILLEASFVVLILSLYKGVASTPRTLATGIAGLIGILLPSLYLLRVYIKSHASGRRLFSLIFAMNLVTVLAIGIAAELVLRVNTVPNSHGVEAFGTTLLPKDWHAVTTWNRRLLEENPRSISYLVPDDLLGWTVAPNRTSKDGLYMSSQEGIRSQEVGVSLKESQPAYRIAIVGDSFTFGLGVPFENTWGAQLKRKLNEKVEILNFGVDGYGIDQAYLRYHRDAKPFKSKMVVFSFVEWDLLRALHVYPFIGLPEWSIPFAKPRFTMLNEKLELLNTPLMAPKHLFELQTVSSLPFIEYESGYAAEQWEGQWYQHSALVRYLLSRFPRWPKASSLFSEATMVDINAEILGRFVREAEIADMIPLLVYLPSRTDFKEEERRQRALLFSALRNKGLPYEDLTPCMRRGVYSEMFLKGDSHYSTEGNALAAECLKPIIQKRM
jgi:hypothetical protein